jgi:hypothetical protein
VWPVRGGQSRVGRAEVACPLRRRDGADELFPLPGKDPAHVASDPVDLPTGACGDGAEHHRDHAVRMALGVGQGEGDAPGAADDNPAVDSQVLAQPLDVPDQVRRGVRRQIGILVAGERSAA